MRVVADSHSILWFVVAPKLLSDMARETLLEAERTDGIAVSGATLFDLWYATQKPGPTRVDSAHYDQVISIIEDPAANVVVLPVDKGTAAHAGFASRDDLPDPWDRMIVATVLEHGLSLVTKDKRIWDLNAIPTIW